MLIPILKNSPPKSRLTGPYTERESSAAFPLGCKAQLVSIKNFKVGNLSEEREDYRKSPDPKRRDVNGIHRSLVPSGAPKIGKNLYRRN